MIMIAAEISIDREIDILKIAENYFNNSLLRVVINKEIY